MAAFVGYYGYGTRLRLRGPAGKVANRRARREAELRHEEKARLKAEYAERRQEAEARAAEHKAANSGLRGVWAKAKRAIGRVLGKRGA